MDKREMMWHLFLILLSSGLVVWFLVTQLSRPIDSPSQLTIAIDSTCNKVTAALTDSQAISLKANGKEVLANELSVLYSAHIDKETTFLTIRAGVISLFLAVLSFAISRNDRRISIAWVLFLSFLVLTVYIYDRLQSHYASRSAARQELIRKTILEFDNKSPREICSVVYSRLSTLKEPGGKFRMVLNPTYEHWIVYGPIAFILIWIRRLTKRFGGDNGTEAKGTNRAA